MPRTLPIFPLEGAMLLPGGLLPLNIFEQKYIKMIDDALASHRMIGMIQPNSHTRENTLYSTGCAGRITGFTEMDDNRYTIILTGLCRFEVEDELTSITPYRTIQANWGNYKDDLVDDCETIEIDREEFVPLLQRYFILNNMDCDWDVIQQTRCETLITTLPMICPFAPEEQQALLEAKTLDNRYNVLTSMLKIALKANGSNNNTIRH